MNSAGRQAVAGQAATRSPKEKETLDSHAQPTNELRGLDLSAVGADGAGRVTEQDLAALWGEVLCVQDVDRLQNFFELGGHSLSATQMLSRVRERWGVDLPLRAVFEAPTVHEFAGFVAQRRPALQHRVDSDTIRTLPRAAGLHTSFSQRRMWLVQQLEPDTTAYNMPFALRLRGSLDPVALERALVQVASHHEAFGTRFVCRDGEPIQFIAESVAVPLMQIDLRHLPGTEREAEARGALRRVATHHFDLSRAALHTTTLLRLGDEDHVLVWLMHHAIADQWAAGILLGELQQVYSAQVRGEPLTLRAPGIEFADYAEWQRSARHQDRLDQQLDYWRTRLAELQPLTLPTDKPRRGPLSGSGGNIQRDLGADRIGAIRRLSLHHGATPFMTMLACFNILMARYSGQADVAVGVPVANRNHLAAETLVGTLVNTVVMRNRVQGEDGFAELLAQVKETALQAHANQDVPFSTLVEQLGVRRDRTFSPLVQVMFNLLNTPYPVDGFTGLKAEAFDFDHGSAQFDLSLTVDIDTFGQVHLEYATDLFEQATAARILDGYLTLLDQVLAGAHAKVRDFDVIGSAQRAELAAWNGTDRSFEAGLRLGDLIRRQASQSGDAVAVIFEGRRVSYRELDAAAQHLALRLRAAGAGPGDLVGVCLERGIELVTALVGVVYSGAAYVPLDPGYPSERLARMCEDAKLALVVTQDAAWRRVGATLPPSLAVIHMDSACEAGATAQLAASRPATPEPVTVAPTADGFTLTGSDDDPAYVIFTSGSTGRPKGAMNAHKGVVNWLQWMQAEYHLTPNDRVLLKTPYSFDVSLREFFWPLTTGATIVVARPDGHRESDYLVELIQREHVTLLHFVPSMLRIFLDEPGLEECTSVQRVVCSGEALPADAVDLFFQRMPRSRLCNLYGPTEAAVEVTYWECRPGDPSGIVPIGRPVANTQMHVLDSRLRPQPIGVPGDLYIGGVQVGMGYASRPELTAERFIPDPFRPGRRLYKTGDLARWLSNGTIEYLGRSDDQVKIRGHRIELGEIETQLGAHPGVARCVVIVREDTPGDKRLVSYVVPQGPMPLVGALREHLRQTLPDYMVPNHCVRLDEIPLLPNGKTNRAALPMPTEEAVVRDTAFWVPRTDTEVALAQIWQRLLGVEQVSATDNFFDLGGHSLLAMRAVSEIQKLLDVRISVRRLVFESLGQLASSLEVQSPAIQAYAPAKSSTVKYLVSGLQRMLLSRSASRESR